MNIINTIKFNFMKRLLRFYFDPAATEMQNDCNVRVRMMQLSVIDEKCLSSRDCSQSD